MSIGLLNLINIGKENVFLSTNPDITYFKKVYNKHTNYTIEQTPQYFKTTPDFGKRCTVNIGKNADLISTIYLFVELPNVNIEALNNKKFKWVSKIGLALINFIEIEIGGNIIDRHYSDWLNIWHELTVKIGIKKAYDKSIGNITELNSYSKSKKSYKLYIPLTFWFCLDKGLSLPVISLKYNNIKIHVQFNEIKTCFLLSPSNYIKVLNNFCLIEENELIIQTIQNKKIFGKFIYFDSKNKYIYYDSIKEDFEIPTSGYDPLFSLISEKSKQTIYIEPGTIVIKDYNYFNYNYPSLISSYLLIDYIYLDKDERNKFILNNSEYIIPIIQTIPEKTIKTVNNIYNLLLNSPIKLLVWRTLLESNKIDNDIFNYSSYPYSNQESISKVSIYCNSVNLTELEEIEYYTFIQKYQYDFYNESKGIYTYSFALEPKNINLTGSINFDKIENVYLKLTLNSIISYQNPVLIQAYGIQYKLFKIKDGIAIF